jgi:cytochrome c5
MPSRRAACLSLVPLVLTGCQASPEASKKTVAQYAQYCASCHESGAANAPRRGDVDSWAKRLRKGTPVLLESIRKGPVGMPSAGACKECSDEDLLALLAYLSAPKH